jgi:hypothetical protein
VSGSSASSAILTGYASLLFSALLDDSYVMKKINDLLFEDDITTFLRNTIIYNQRPMHREVHIDPWVQCSIGRKQSLIDMVQYSLNRLENNNLFQDSTKPQAFRNLKMSFASHRKASNMKKYEE